MKKSIALIFTVFVTLSAVQFVSPGDGQSAFAQSGEWYEGGSLHGSNLGQWSKATSANKLATAADFLAASGDYNSLDRLKREAQGLVSCINEVANDQSNHSQQTPEMAAACMILLGYR